MHCEFALVQKLYISQVLPALLSVRNRVFGFNNKRKALLGDAYWFREHNSVN